MSFANIPVELTRLKQWCVWRLETVDGAAKPTKIPYNPVTNKKSSSTDPNSWCTYEEATFALMAAKFYSGIGFFFSVNDPYCGIDLDDPYQRKHDGSFVYPDPEMIRRNHEYVMNVFDSYQELSPSNHGVHIIIKGMVPHGRRRSGVEVYSSERYFTFTGNVVKAAPIREFPEALNAMWQSMAAPKETNGNYTPLQTSETHTDEEIIEMASRATNGEKFDKLWEMDEHALGELYPSQTGDAFDRSRADMALVDIIAYYTQNRNQISRIFRNSKLGKRKKAQRDNYVGYMINKCFDMMLPPIDISALEEEFNAARAKRLAAVTSPAANEVATTTTRPAAIPALHGTSAKPAGEATAFQSSPAGTPIIVDGFDVNYFLTHSPTYLINDIAKYIFDSAPRPVREIALVGAIGLFAGIVGRQFNISGTGLNQYMMLVAHSGKGKEAISSGTSRIMNAIADLPNQLAMQHVGPADVGSGQGLIRFLSTNASKAVFSVVGEFGLKLKQITDDRANSADIMLRKVLLDLYGKSGAGQSLLPTVYSDSAKNTDKVNSPCFTLIGESTPELFYEALDESSVASGLLPRFTIIEYNGPRPPYHANHFQVPIPGDLITTLHNLIMLVGEMAASGRVAGIGIYPDADDELERLNQYAEFKYHEAQSDVTRELWNRFHLKILKLAGILAVAHNYHAPMVDLHMVKWASSLILTDTLRLLSKFSKGEMGTNNEDLKKEEAIRRALLKYYETENHQFSPTDDRVMHAARMFRRSYLQRQVIKFFKANGSRTQNDMFLSMVKQLESNGFIRQMKPADVEAKTGIKSSAAVFVVSDMNWLNAN